MRRLTRRRSVATLLPLCVAAALCTPRFLRANPTVYEVGSDPSVGYNLISWSNFSGSAANFVDAVNRLDAAGFRSVSISPVRFVNTTTGAITENNSSPSLSAIGAGVARAQELGMRVTLNPFVEPQNFSNWRGYYNPFGTAADTFWADYKDYLLEVAAIAQTNHVESMTVGTELRAITRNSSHNADWTDVIDAVNSAYDGQLGYAANWDNYDNSNVVNTIWENPAIDFVGIDSYFSGGRGLDVSTAEADNSQGDPDGFLDVVTAAWSDKLQNELLPFAAARKGGVGMPLEFTEVGYRTRNRTVLTPQNESTNDPLDRDEQALAFRGLLQALDGLGDQFTAIHVWNWDMPGGTNNWAQNPNITSGLVGDNVVGARALRDFALNFVEPLAGDYNRDGVVSAADYTVWRNTLGEFVNNLSGADGSNNGVIDQDDYDVWKTNFGATLGGGSVASVPEPESIVLAPVVLIGTSLGRKRRSRSAI